MGLFEQLVGEREGLQFGDGCVDRFNVVVHFPPVIALFRLDLFFGHQGFVDAGLGALDLAGGLGLLENMHFDEQVDIRHDQRKSVI